MKAAFLFCTVALIAAGCSVFGDRFGSGKAVSLKFLQVERPNPSLTVATPEVREALEITDTVLLPTGLIRDTPSPAPDVNGLIAYYHYTPERPTSCEVFLTGDRLNIVFGERYERHSTTYVKKMCAELAEKFRSHYDPKRVRVQE
jgi:hypothetical protein